MQRWLWIVHLLVCPLIVFWIKLSVVVSPEAVSSSNNLSKKHKHQILQLCCSQIASAIQGVLCTQRPLVKLEFSEYLNKAKQSCATFSLLIWGWSRKRQNFAKTLKGIPIHVRHQRCFFDEFPIVNLIKTTGVACCSLFISPGEVLGSSNWIPLSRKTWFGSLRDLIFRIRRIRRVKSLRTFTRTAWCDMLLKFGNWHFLCSHGSQPIILTTEIYRKN